MPGRDCPAPTMLRSAAGRTLRQVWESAGTAAATATGSSAGSRTVKQAPPPGAVAGRHVPAVGVHDPGDDRKPQARPGAAALATALGSPEALERVTVDRRAGRGRGRGPRAPGPRRRSYTETSIAVPGGVCTSALRMRFASTCRSSSGSPTTGAGPVGPHVDRAVRRRHPRVVDRVASEHGEVDVLAPGLRGSRRAARASAGPRRGRPSAPPRPRSAASPCAGRRRSPAAPIRSSSAYPRIDASGVRSSCEASARKRRSRSSLACRSAKASSSRLSIALSDRPSRPISVFGVAGLTRCDMSPPAIAPAVRPIRSSGRRPIPTTNHAPIPSSSSTPPITSPSISSRRSSVWETSRSGIATTVVPAPKRFGQRDRAVAQPGAVLRVDGRDRPGRERRGKLRRGQLRVGEDGGPEHLPARVAKLRVGPRRQVRVGARRPEAAVAAGVVRRASRRAPAAAAPTGR